MTATVPERLQLLSPSATPAVEQPLVPRATAIVGRVTVTNARLAQAFAGQGIRARIVTPSRELAFPPGTLVLNRLDVLPSLDGVEDGLGSLARVEASGTLLNTPQALVAAHDKLWTAIALARHDVDHPRTVHVREQSAPVELSPPYIVKPRFGSWGRDVFRCRSDAELRACLQYLGHRRWFRRHGALVQELVPSAGYDLRIVVAHGTVVGAVERLAPAGDWRTNISLGGLRRPAVPSAAAESVARRAAAAIDIDLAGIDLIPRADGGYTTIEINGAVDFTPQYGATPYEAAVHALLGSSAAQVASAGVAS